jgi:hypothetical protein
MSANKIGRLPRCCKPTLIFAAIKSEELTQGDRWYGHIPMGVSADGNQLWFENAVYTRQLQYDPATGRLPRPRKIIDHWENQFGLDEKLRDVQRIIASADGERLWLVNKSDDWRVLEFISPRPLTPRQRFFLALRKKWQSFVQMLHRAFSRIQTIKRKAGQRPAHNVIGLGQAA